MAPVSQGLEPPGNLVRFTQWNCNGLEYLLRLAQLLTLAVTMIDAVWGAGIATHVHHLARLAIETIGGSKEIEMRINVYGVWEFVA